MNNIANENKDLTMFIEKSIEEQKRVLEPYQTSKWPESKSKISWECDEILALKLERLAFLPLMNDCEKVNRSGFRKFYRLYEFR